MNYYGVIELFNSISDYPWRLLMYGSVELEDNLSVKVYCAIIVWMWCAIG